MTKEGMFLEKLKKVKKLLGEKQLIGLFLTGSTLYKAKLDGNQENDYIAIISDEPNDLLTGKFVSKQVIKDDVDVKIYSFRQFAQLVRKGNPNLLELFVDKSCLLYTTDQFEGFYNKLGEFVFEIAKRKLLQALSGIAFSNLKRVKNKNNQEKNGKSVFNVLKSIQYLNQVAEFGKLVSIDFSDIKNIKQKGMWTTEELDDLEKQLQQAKESCHLAVEKSADNSDLVDKFNNMCIKFLQSELVPKVYVQLVEFLDDQNKRSGIVSASLNEDDTLKYNKETLDLLKSKDDLSNYQVNVYEFDFFDKHLEEEHTKQH